MGVTNQIHCQPSGENRRLEALDHFGKLRDGVRNVNAVTGQDHRAFGSLQKVQQLVGRCRDIGGWLVLFGRGESGQLGGIDLGRLNIERDIQPHRARTTGRGPMQGFFEMITNSIRLHHGHGVLGDGFDDGYDVDFLRSQLSETAAFEIGSLDLAGQEQARHGVEPSTRDARDGICAAGAARHHCYAYAAADFRVGLSRNRTGLLVEVAYKLQAFASAQGLVQVHGAPAGEHEDMLDALVGDEFHYVIREFHGNR